MEIRMNTNQKQNGFASSPVPARPNPEVVADARRRTFSLDYKLRILARLGNLWAVLVSSESLGAEAVELAAGGVKGPLLFLRVLMIEEWPVILY